MKTGTIGRWSSFATIALLVVVSACTSEAVTPTASMAFSTVVPTDDARPVKLDQEMMQVEERQGGVLRVETANSIVPDPVFDYGAFSSMLHAEIFSGLMSIVDDPNAPLRPELAETYSVSDGGTTYEFILHRDLKFSDGSPLTAHDVAWSWRRALHSSTGSERAAHVLGAIAGASDLANGSAEELAGVKVVDDRTLQVTLEHPASNFLAALADPVASVLKPGNVANWGVDFSVLRTEDWRPFKFQELPAGTGPFRLEEYDFETGRATMSRNDHYHGEPANVGRVEFVTNDVEGVDLFELQEVDITPFFPDLQTAMSGDPTIVPIPEPHGTTFIALNSAVAPFDDIRFRRALLAAAERYRMGDFGQMQAAALLNPGLPGADAETTAGTYDLEAAKRLLAESDYENGQPLVFHDFGGVVFADSFEMLAEGWRETLGLTFDVHVIASPTVYRSAMQAGEVQMAYREIYATYPSQYELLQGFVETFGEGDDSPEIRTLRSMLQAASEQTDDANLNDAYAAMDRYIAEQALALPLYWTQTGDGGLIRVQPWVEDFAMHAYHSGSIFKNVWVNETAPERSRN